MSRIFATLILVLVAFGSLFAQDEACPQIIIEAPMGIGQPGEPQPYSVRFVPSENLPTLSYLWSVTTHRGEVGMVRGQGTPKIFVPWSDEVVTVVVKVIGLRSPCPDNASATAVYDPPPVAEKVEEFVGSLSKISGNRFDNIIQTARQNPHAQLYIMLSGTRGNAARSIKAKRLTLTSRILSKLHDHRVTFVESDRRDDRVVVWLVPAGADLPRP